MRTLEIAGDPIILFERRITDRDAQVFVMEWLPDDLRKRLENAGLVGLCEKFTCEIE